MTAPVIIQISIKVEMGWKHQLVNRSINDNKFTHYTIFEILLNLNEDASDWLRDT
jgi:hypothetical protein